MAKVKRITPDEEIPFVCLELTQKEAQLLYMFLLEEGPMSSPRLAGIVNALDCAGFRRESCPVLSALL